MLDSDAVHVHGALLGQALSHSDAAALFGLVLGLTDEASLLELVEAVADVLSSCHLSDLLSCSTAGFATEVLTESLDTDLLSHVELVADGSGAHVEPVVVEGVQLLVEGCLNGHRPL